MKLFVRVRVKTRHLDSNSCKLTEIRRRQDVAIIGIRQRETRHECFVPQD